MSTGLWKVIASVWGGGLLWRDAPLYKADWQPAWFPSLQRLKRDAPYGAALGDDGEL